MIGKKEILWEEVDLLLFQGMMQKIYSNTQLFVSGISFGCQNLKVNIQYDKLEFKELLKEKFDLSEPYLNVPYLTFVEYKTAFGFTLPYEQYGYVSKNNQVALVFASSFGVFKSVISGYASLCLGCDEYTPVHGSVFSIGKRGVVLVGGTLAGKTTTLLKLVEMAIINGDDVKILTDDWAVVSEKSNGYIAQTFDQSISLRKCDFVENQNLCFCHHDDLEELVQKRGKVSIRPESLYGIPLGTDRIKIDIVILLKPQPGHGELRCIGSSDFAREVVDTAYHYPYISQEQIDKHYIFWERVFSSLIVYEFSTRSLMGNFQDINAVRRLIT